MRLVVLDTDAFSFFFKHDTRAALYAKELVGASPCLSFQSVAELELWAIARRWGERRRQRLADVLNHYLLFPSDKAMIRLWAQISAHRRKLGREIGCGDPWIAAAALRHSDIPGLNLVTHGAGSREPH